MDTPKPFLVKHILEIDEETSGKRSPSAECEINEVKDQFDDQQENTLRTQDQSSAQVNRRKIRRCFRAEQLDYLERCFIESIYPEASTRKKIAQELRVSKDRVQVWFQNRRAKARKQWKQQHCTLLGRSTRRSPSSIPHHSSRQDMHARFPSPLRFEHLHRELHIQRYERGGLISHTPVFGSGSHSQEPTSVPMCSCCPLPRSFSHFRQYDPRMSMIPTASTNQHLCQCRPIRSQAKL